MDIFTPLTSLRRLLRGLRYTPSRPGAIAWHKKQIALQQLNYQKQHINFAIVQVELNEVPENADRTYRLKVQLKHRLNLLKVAEKEIISTPVNPKRFWSVWVLAIYAWSVKDRMKVKDG